MVISFAAWVSSFREGLIFCVNGVSVTTDSCALRNYNIKSNRNIRRCWYDIAHTIATGNMLGLHDIRKERRVISPLFFCLS